MTASSSPTASTRGTRARPSSPVSTRASRSMSCALGGTGGRGGRRRTASQSSRAITKVTFEWPSPIGFAVSGPAPRPRASRNASSGSVTSSGGRALPAASAWVATMSSAAGWALTTRSGA